MGEKNTSDRTNSESSTPGSGSTADHVTVMSDTELAAEFARMAHVVKTSEEKLAALPRPFPPEMSGYRSPAFHLYLDRKYLNRLANEVISRKNAQSSTTEL